LHGRKRSDEALLRPVRKSEALQTLVADDPLQSLRAHLTLTVSAKLREMDDIIKTARMSGLDI
jgi:CHASE3 domain sensor protein